MEIHTNAIDFVLRYEINFIKFKNSAKKVSSVSI